MYRHDRNYEQLFRDVRNKLEQVGFCTAGSRASMKSLLFQGFSVPSLVHPKACLLISQQALAVCNLALCCQSGLPKKREMVQHFSFLNLGLCCLPRLEQFEQEKKCL